MKRHAHSRFFLILSLWLAITILFSQGVFAFNACTTVQAGLFPVLGYDGQTQVQSAYDDHFKPASNYDGARMLTLDKKIIRPAVCGSPLAEFAEFLAAEGGGVQLSQKGLDLVGNHLAQFDEFAPNTQMMQGLQDALAAGQKVTGANANFYLHEASEATFMGNGLSYDAAHAAALGKYGVSPFSLYTPEVIQAKSQSHLCGLGLAYQPSLHHY